MKRLVYFLTLMVLFGVGISKAQTGVRADQLDSIEAFTDDMYVWIYDPNSSPQSHRFTMWRLDQRILDLTSTGVAFPLSAPDGDATNPSYGFSTSGVGMFAGGSSLRLASGGSANLVVNTSSVDLLRELDMNSQDITGASIIDFPDLTINNRTISTTSGNLVLSPVAGAAIAADGVLIDGVNITGNLGSTTLHIDNPGGFSRVENVVFNGNGISTTGGALNVGAATSVNIETPTQTITINGASTQIESINVNNASLSNTSGDEVTVDDNLSVTGSISEAQSITASNSDPDTNITSPSEGTLSYDTGDDEFRFYNGSSWQPMGGSSAGNTNAVQISDGSGGFSSANILLSGNTISNNTVDGSDNQTLGFSGGGGTALSQERGAMFRIAGNEADVGAGSFFFNMGTASAPTFTVGNNSSQSVLVLANSGEVILPQYGAGTFTGTPTYYLAVASNGDIIEEPIPAGGGGIGGAIANNQIAVGSTTADEIEGNSELTYNGATLQINDANARQRITDGGTNVFVDVGYATTSRFGTFTSPDPAVVAGSTSVSGDPAIIFYGSSSLDLGAEPPLTIIGGTINGSAVANRDIIHFMNDETVIAEVKPDGGWVHGSATGGSQGAGTINATAVYDDGVQLTDYVFEIEFGGESKDGIHFERNTLEEEVRYVKEHYGLSSMVNRQEWEEKDGVVSTGEMINDLWKTVEIQFLYIGELSDRIKDLESKQPGN